MILHTHDVQILLIIKMDKNRSDQTPDGYSAVGEIKGTKRPDKIDDRNKIPERNRSIPETELKSKLDPEKFEIKNK